MYAVATSYMCRVRANVGVPLAVMLAEVCGNILIKPSYSHLILW